MQEPMKVLNFKTGKLENCHVGEGCQLHYHQDVNKAKKDRTGLKNTIITSIGGIVGAGAGFGLATLFSVSIMPIVGLVIGGLVLGAGLTRAIKYFNDDTRSYATYEETQEDVRKRQFEDANDDITSVEEYNAGSEKVKYVKGNKFKSRVPKERAGWSQGSGFKAIRWRNGSRF